MALVYYLGEIPVLREELEEQQRLGNLDKKDLEFREGRPKAVIAFDSSAVGGFPYSPLRIGQPLIIEILGFYTGDAARGFLGSKSDVMVTSALKDRREYKQAPQALNLIKEKVEKFKYYTPGNDVGCSVVYYSPAIIGEKFHCTYQAVADAFKEKFMDDVGDLMRQAAGFPVLATTGPFLLSVSAIMKTVKGVGKALFESDPFLTESEVFDFTRTGGSSLPLTGCRLVCADADFFGELRHYVAKADSNGTIRLIHRETSVPYSGNAPYLLVNVDAKEQPDLKAFQPYHATAETLNRFFKVEKREQHLIEEVGTMMQLYNDYQQYKKSLAIQKQLEDLEPESEAWSEAQLKLEALQKNMLTEHFKVDSGQS